MPFNVDPDLPVPLGTQLRGVIEYGIVCGQLAPGLRLPPVRAMATQVGIAPMTVSQVYKELKDAGLLETKPGHGTFVSAKVSAEARPRLLEMQRKIDALLDDASAAGMAWPDLMGLINARINRRSRPLPGLNLVFIGLFEDATRAYGEDIQARLPSGDTIWTTTFNEIAGNQLARQRAVKADLILTLGNRKNDVQEMFGAKKQVFGVTYIPSERTRTLLAQIDPLAQVAMVSTFPQFLPMMKAGLLRFAPHVHDAHATLLESPTLAEELQRADVVVYASGSKRVTELIRPGATAFEYRHTPDPREIDQALLPLLESIRAKITPKSVPAAKSPLAPNLRRSHEN
jgi:DNA-binding transcriptional regulator YhcF (GntR family)